MRIIENHQEELQKQIFNTLKRYASGGEYATFSATIGALYEYYNSFKHSKSDAATVTRIIAKLNDQYSDMWSGR